MPTIIGAVVLIALLYALKRGTGTANLAPFPFLGTTPAPYNNGGSSPIDVGGNSMTVPDAVLQWHDLANKYAQINAILDPEEILAIIWQESTGNQNAIHEGDQPDGSGSYGLMQLSLNVGKAYAPDDVVSSVDLLNAETNIKAGSAFLAYLKNRYSGSPNWVAAYNEGETKFRIGVQDPGYVSAFQSHVTALQELG